MLEFVFFVVLVSFFLFSEFSSIPLLVSIDFRLISQRVLVFLILSITLKPCSILPCPIPLFYCASIIWSMNVGMNCKYWFELVNNFSPSVAFVVTDNLGSYSAHWFDSKMHLRISNVVCRVEGSAKCVWIAIKLPLVT
jgi:hypothetical protein